MTHVHLCHDRRGRLCGFTMSGHTKSAPSGEDIVCAGLSAVAITATNALEKVAGVPARSRTRDGYLRVRLPARMTARRRLLALTILRTARQGFYDIANAHPRHARVYETTIRRCNHNEDELAALCAQKGRRLLP